jgi:hypothetical protein
MLLVNIAQTDTWIDFYVSKLVDAFFLELGCIRSGKSRLVV